MKSSLAATIAAALMAVVAPACMHGNGDIVQPDRGPFSLPTTSQTAAQLTLSADLVDGPRRAYRFVAMIAGGPDNNPDLYCVATTWGFGDAPSMTVTPSCAPWTPEVSIQRRLEMSHIYEAPGRYDVTVAYGPLTAQTTLQVR
jgi:hypothetical protein